MYHNFEFIEDLGQPSSLILLGFCEVRKSLQRHGVEYLVQEFCYQAMDTCLY